MDIPFELHGIIYIAEEQAEMFGVGLTGVQCGVISSGNYFKHKTSLMLQEVLPLSLQYVYSWNLEDDRFSVATVVSGEGTSRWVFDWC